MNSNLPISGVYDRPAFREVSKFQEKYSSDVLTPWGIEKPTGYVYLTTQRKINLIKCPELKIPMPELKIGLWID